MAATENYSDQITALTANATAIDYPNPYDLNGKLRVYRFTYTASAALDANSTIELVRFQPGRFLLICDLSRVAWSAYGAGRTLDIGYAAYTDYDGVSQAAVVDYFDDAIDVSSAGGAALGSDCDAGEPKAVAIAAKTEFIVKAKVLGSTLPAAGTLAGYIACAVE